MKNSLLTCFFVVLSTSLFAQIFSPDANSASLTQYTNGAVDDTIYFYCIGETGTLTAIPTSGVPDFDFTWYNYDSATNAWLFYSQEDNVATSTITNLVPGGYRVTILDANGTLVNCLRAWISEVTQGPEVDVAPIAPGCLGVQLTGTITPGAATAYYNPPQDPLIINAETEITVCFWANHTFVSDLGFYMVGPTACGSPTITLAPSPGICNGGNDINGMCFTTEDAPNFNVCGANTPLQGTYDSYGAGSTPINWAPLIGCDASQPGWKVQIYDCVGADVGALTHATITFIGVNQCGDSATVVYDSGTINSTIFDNSCSAATASIFTVPPVPATVVDYEYNYLWSADPYVLIPDSTSSLDIYLQPAPTQDTYFTLEFTSNFIGTGCGGNNSDTELFVYTPPVQPNITDVSILCVSTPAFNLEVDFPGGLFTGPGIVDATTGLFNPNTAGPGLHEITYSLSTGGCVVSDVIFIEVVGQYDANIVNIEPLCELNGPVQLTAGDPGGTWSGVGITDAVNGIFDPNVSGPGTFLITYSITGLCGDNDNTQITVTAEPEIDLSGLDALCLNDGPVTLEANVNGGLWSGPGIIDATNGIFDPTNAGIGTHVISFEYNGECPANESAEITVYNFPDVDAGDDLEVCPGETVQLNANGALTFEWSPSTYLSSSTIESPFSTPTNDITYTLVSTDANGCSNTDEIFVDVLPPAVINVDDLYEICFGESVELDASGLVTYNWTPTFGLSDNDIANPTASPDQTVTYTVSGTNAAGCTASAEVTVDVTVIVPSFSAAPDSGFSPLNVIFVGNASGDSFFWDFGNGDTYNTNNPNDTTSSVYYEEGAYTVTFTVTDEGCSGSATTTVLVFNQSFLFIPNIVTPNGDGDNDVFKIESVWMDTAEILIFDRWGKKVGEITAPNKTWNPEDFTDGTYYYSLHCVGLDGVKYDTGGYFQVVRGE